MVAGPEEAAIMFADDACGDGGGHFERSGEAETPLEIVADHHELGGGAAAEGRHAGGIHRARAGDDEAAFAEDDFEAALDVFARSASRGRAGVGNDRDVVSAFGSQDQADHFDGKVEAVGDDLAGEGGVGEQCAHAHHFGAEPAVRAGFAQGPVDGVVGMDEMAGAVGSGAANFEHGGARVANSGNAAAFVKELAEFGGAFAFRGVREDADEAAGEVPEFFVFGANGVAEAFELVGAAFVGMEVGAFDMDAAEVGVEFSSGVLVRESLEGGGHLLVSFGHDRGEHGGDAVLGMEFERDVVAFGIGSDEVMGFAAVVVDIDQAGGENEILAIDGAGAGGKMGGRFVDPDGGDFAIGNEKGAFDNEVGEGEAGILEERGGRIRHGGSFSRTGGGVPAELEGEHGALGIGERRLGRETAEGCFRGGSDRAGRDPEKGLLIRRGDGYIRTCRLRNWVSQKRW